MIDKRALITRGLGGALGAALAVRPGPGMAQGLAFAMRPPLIPIRARPDRIFKITVCLRPFRPAGPRIEAEEVAGKHVVHHYGHGGSGWSLSWGSAQDAVPLALAKGNAIAVIGAGAIGLTTAITAQRMGARVTIYAKERFPQVRSARATGGWTPASRIAMEGEAAPDLGARWERMARASFAMHQSYLGVAGNPVEWTDRYLLSDAPPTDHTGARRADTPPPPGTPVPQAAGVPGAPERRFVDYEERVADLTPRPELLAPGTHPFPAPYVRRTASLTYNVADLCRQLEADFMVAGGRFVPIELYEPADIARLAEPVVINCTGYGARALFKDESLVPVRGQIAWLIPQDGVSYGVRYKEKDLQLLARRDGIVVQALGENDFYGFGDADEAPDVDRARADVALAATFFRASPPQPW